MLAATLDRAAANTQIQGSQTCSSRSSANATNAVTNKVFNQWPSIFNNDSTLTSAILDRVLHHAETVFIEGKSYRMKDRIEL